MKATIFAAAATAVLAVFSVGGADAQCATRRSWKELSAGEKTRYLNAVQALKNRPSNYNPNNPEGMSYDDFVRLHLENKGVSHGVPAFFPWHRMFMQTWARALKSVDPGVEVVYWSWTLDAQAPERSDVFGPNAFGSNGRPGDNCVKDGLMANWAVNYPPPGMRAVSAPQNCVVRCSRFSTWWGPEQLRDLVQSSLDYDTYRKGFEATPHAYIHNQVGGSCGDMATMYSPADALFFLHHGMVDKAWWKWQNLCPDVYKQMYLGTTPTGASASASDILQPWGVKVQDVLDTEKMSACYTYSKDASDSPALDSSKCPGGGSSGSPTDSSSPTPSASGQPAKPTGWFDEVLFALVGAGNPGAANATASRTTSGVTTPTTAAKKNKRALELPPIVQSITSKYLKGLPTPTALPTALPTGLPGGKDFHLPNLNGTLGKIVHGTNGTIATPTKPFNLTHNPYFKIANGTIQWLNTTFLHNTTFLNVT
ncbi:hypothetical protein HK104_004866, partial [Borealophlyctis nickersoniae]